MKTIQSQQEVNEPTSSRDTNSPKQQEEEATNNGTRDGTSLQIGDSVHILTKRAFRCMHGTIVELEENWETILDADGDVTIQSTT